MKLSIEKRIIIGDRIKKGRKQRKINQQELADMVGVSRYTISQYENAKIKSLTGYILRDIQKALNIKLI